MKQNFLHLLSSTPCTMSINGNFLGTIDNAFDFEIDIIPSVNKFFLEYNPICDKNNYIPYTVMFETNKSLIKCENKYVNIVPFPNGHYDIIFNPFSYLKTNETDLILSKNFGKYFVSITNSNFSQISIFDNEKLCFSKVIKSISTANCQIFKDVLLIQGIGENDYFILIFDCSKHIVIYEDFVHSINVQSGYVETLKNTYDISHHAVVCKVDFETKLSQKYYVYEKNICHYSKCMEIIPQDFLECLKAEDESKMKTLLHTNLANSKLQNFQNYFGKFDKIYLNRHLNFQDTLNYTLIGNNIKNYNFIMENNKIKDIQEVF